MARATCDRATGHFFQVGTLMIFRTSLVAVFVGLAPFTSQAAGNAVEGATVFKKCAACHNADKPENKIGPHLLGIIGRRAGSVESYVGYSEAMKTAGNQGLIWDQGKLAEYLTAPKKFLPGNRMSFTGLKSPEDITNLEAYLASQRGSQPQ